MCQNIIECVAIGFVQKFRMKVISIQRYDPILYVIIVLCKNGSPTSLVQLDLQSTTTYFTITFFILPEHVAGLELSEGFIVHKLSHLILSQFLHVTLKVRTDVF
jgi:hypothetical protein